MLSQYIYKRGEGDLLERYVSLLEDSYFMHISGKVNVWQESHPKHVVLEPTRGSSIEMGQHNHRSSLDGAIIGASERHISFKLYSLHFLVYYLHQGKFIR